MFFRPLESYIYLLIVLIQLEFHYVYIEEDSFIFIHVNVRFSKEDVEKTKQQDLLEEFLREMTGEFPDLTRIFIHERDQYMAYVLMQLAHGLYNSRRKYLIGHGVSEKG